MATPNLSRPHPLAAQPVPPRSKPATVLAFPPSRNPAPPQPVQRPYASYPAQNINIRFGQRIRQLRTLHGMTQSRMAVEFGIDRSFISDLECGRKSTSLSILQVIALGFRVSLSELFQDL